MESYTTYEDLKERKIKANLKLQKYYDTFAALFAVLGWVWQYSEYDRYYEEISEIGIWKGSVVMMLANQAESIICLILRAATSASTLALLLCIFGRYQKEVQIQILEAHYKRIADQRERHITNEDRLKLKLYMQMVIEMAYLSIHSIPRINLNFRADEQKNYLEYSLDIMLFLAMQARFYLLLRLLKHYSQWMSDSAKAVCYSQGTPLGISFAFKSLLKATPALLVSCLIAFLLILGGFSVRALERPFMHVSGLNWDNYYNGFWQIFAIITTVGYGDMYPRTHPGRFFAVLVCFAGQFLISLMVSAIANILAFSFPQERAFFKIKEMQEKEIFRIVAGRIIVYGYKHYLEIKKYKVHPERSKYYPKLMENMLLFKEQRKFLEMEELNIPIEFLVEKIKTHLHDKKFELVRTMFSNKVLLSRLQTLENQMKASETLLTYLHYQNSKILEVLHNTASETSVNSPFDTLTVDNQALRHFDILQNLDPAPQLKEIKYDLDVLRQPLVARTEVNHKLYKQLNYRVERSKNIISHELLKIEQEEGYMLPPIAFRHKRILASNPEALRSLKNYIKLRSIGKNYRRHYLSGEQLMEAILAGKYLELTPEMIGEVSDDNSDREENEYLLGDDSVYLYYNKDDDSTYSRKKSMKNGKNDIKKKVQFQGVKSYKSLQSMVTLSPKRSPTHSPKRSYQKHMTMQNLGIKKIKEEEEESHNDFKFIETTQGDKPEGRTSVWTDDMNNSRPLLDVTKEDSLTIPEFPPDIEQDDALQRKMSLFSRSVKDKKDSENGSSIKSSPRKVSAINQEDIWALQNNLKPNENMLNKGLDGKIGVPHDNFMNIQKHSLPNPKYSSGYQEASGIDIMTRNPENMPASYPKNEITSGNDDDIIEQFKKALASVETEEDVKQKADGLELKASYKASAVGRRTHQDYTKDPNFSNFEALKDKYARGSYTFSQDQESPKKLTNFSPENTKQNFQGPSIKNVDLNNPSFRGLPHFEFLSSQQTIPQIFYSRNSSLRAAKDDILPKYQYEEVNSSEYTNFSSSNKRNPGSNAPRRQYWHAVDPELGQ